MIVDQTSDVARGAPSIRKQISFLLSAIFLATSVWFYVDQILVGYQVKDAAAHDRPRGNLSDLYPRWLGSRELLLHGRNPYSDEITIEIQKGFYGRPLDPSRPNDPKDQQAFAYPVYVVFLLAPLIHLPFHTVEVVFHWVLAILLGVSVLLWLRMLRWRLPSIVVASIVVLTLGSLPAVQGIKLQQLSLLVATLLAASAACVESGLLVSAGILLALSTIKPQLAAPLIVWLFLWALSNWKARRRFIYGFVGMMALLAVAGELVLPGWWRMFWQGLAKYHRYTQNASVLDELIPWGHASEILAIAAALLCLWFLWRFRTASLKSEKFGLAIALVMALTVLIVPMYAPYNQVLLLPPILVLAHNRTDFLSGVRALRFLYAAAILALAWQWAASLGLDVVYIFGASDSALNSWKIPLFATFALPVLVFAASVIDIKKQAGFGEHSS
jgi:hypothetical protein